MNAVAVREANDHVLDADLTRNSSHLELSAKHNLAYYLHTELFYEHISGRCVLLVCMSNGNSVDTSGDFGIWAIQNRNFLP